MPSLENIADYTSGILRQHTLQQGQLDNKTSFARIMLFGRVDVKQPYQVFLVSSYIENNNLCFDVVEYKNIYSQQVEATGSGAALYLAEIEKRKDQHTFVSPTDVLRDMINNEVREDVGGNFQAAVAKGINVRLPFILNETPTHNKIEKFSYLGLTEDIIGKMGSCECGLTFEGPPDKDDPVFDIFPRYPAPQP